MAPNRQQLPLLAPTECFRCNVQCTKLMESGTGRPYYKCFGTQHQDGKFWTYDDEVGIEDHHPLCTCQYPLRYTSYTTEQGGFMKCSIGKCRIFKRCPEGPPLPPTSPTSPPSASADPRSPSVAGGSGTLMAGTAGSFQTPTRQCGLASFNRYRGLSTPSSASSSAWTASSSVTMGQNPPSQLEGNNLTPISTPPTSPCSRENNSMFHPRRIKQELADESPTRGPASRTASNCQDHTTPTPTGADSNEWPLQTSQQRGSRGSSGHARSRSATLSTERAARGSSSVLIQVSFESDLAHSTLPQVLEAIGTAMRGCFGGGVRMRVTVDVQETEELPA